MTFARLGEWWTDGGDVIHFSARAAQIYGLGARRAVPRAEIDAMIHPDDKGPVLQHVAGAIETRHDFDVEYRVRRPDGGLVWVHGRGRAVYGEDGRPAGLVGVVSDVSEAKAAAEAERLRAREVEHRAANVFMLIQALIRLTPFRDRDQFVGELDERVAALARAHRVILRARSGLALAELVRRELEPFAGSGEVRAEGPAVSLKAEAAPALCMVLHELATNAVKYGALNSRGGSLSVVWSRGADGGLVLCWTETAPPGVAQPRAEGTGFGSVLLEGLAAQLGGAFRRRISRGGVSAELSVASRNLRWAAASRLRPPAQPRPASLPRRRAAQRRPPPAPGAVR